MSRDLFVNELTGEALTSSDYNAATKAIERQIFHLDRTIDDLKSSLKAAREDHSKQVAALRSIVRESRLQARRPQVVKMRKGAAIKKTSSAD